MRIDDVSLTLFRWDDLPPVTYHAGSSTGGGSSDLGLLRIRTSDGVEGHAFLGSGGNPASMDAAALIRWLKPMLMGQDPMQRERIWQSMRMQTRKMSYRLVGAVDVALWDLAGKVANLPIHALVGTYRTSIPAYASSQLLPSAEAYAEQAQAFKQAGWQAYKIHPPQSLAADRAACEAVRRAVGDGFTLMLDASWSYAYEDALRLGRAIEALGFYWYEDPLRDEDIYGYVKLRQKLDIPILATETPAGGPDTYAIWITERATDFLRGDINTKGGITGMLKAARLAEAFNMNYEVHHSSNSLNNLANLHVAMAIQNTSYFEVLLPDSVQKYGMVRDLEPDADGLLHAPDWPGLGGEIDFDLIAARTEAVLS